MRAEFIPPMLAKLVDSPPEGKEWIHEAKLDGYRTLAIIQKKQVYFFTRNGHDWSERYQLLVDEIQRLNFPDAIFDGEVVALNAEGKPDFNLLQKNLLKKKAQGIVFYAFDLLFLEGKDLR